MNILGLSSYSHDSSASLIVDGKIICSIEEERINREKHTCRFPINAIKCCLKEGNIKMEDIDHIAFFWVPEKEIIGNLGHVIKYFPQSLNLLKTKSGSDEYKIFDRIMLMKTIGSTIQKEFNLKKEPKIHFIEHHMCHAASAFFVSEFDKAAILTIDGRGESTSTMFSKGDGLNITKIKEIKTPHSLGHLYASITDYLGFKAFYDEWKVMGMSAYGKDTYKDLFEDMVLLKNDGTYELNLRYFKFHTHGQAAWLSDYFYQKAGIKREKDSDYLQRHFDIAWGLQYIVEKAGVHLAKHLYEITNLPNLCLAGGVILNCLMNKRIIEETEFKKVFIQPIATDSGTSLGGSLYLYHQILKQKREVVFDSVYLGPEFSAEEIESFLKSRKVNYKKCDDIAKETARYIAEGKIVGWFQGRMESGPRALGNRSIVVNPADANMKEKLNSRVKRREYYRPFAPSVMEEKVFDYFKMPKNTLSPYMINMGEVLEEKRKVIPAVTHADGTARVHTVSKDINPRYWNLINEFSKITGVHVLLNTSFNENEPIVFTPEDAINCFFRTEFDVLAIGDFLIVKEQ